MIPCHYDTFPPIETDAAGVQGGRGVASREGGALVGGARARRHVLGLTRASRAGQRDGRCRAHAVRQPDRAAGRRRLAAGPSGAVRAGLVRADRGGRAAPDAAALSRADDGLTLGLVLPAALEPDRAVLPVVRDQGGAERGERRRRSGRGARAGRRSTGDASRGRRRSRDYRVSMASRSSTSMIVSIRSLRKFGVLARAPAALALGGGAAATTSRAARRARGATVTDEADRHHRRPTTPDRDRRARTRRPRRCPTTATGRARARAAAGGAGDEEPAQTLALFTGQDGQITPRVVRVPAFISIRVELRSGDGGHYALTLRRRTITVRGRADLRVDQVRRPAARREAGREADRRGRQGAHRGDRRARSVAAAY